MVLMSDDGAVIAGGVAGASHDGGRPAPSRGVDDVPAGADGVVVGRYGGSAVWSNPPFTVRRYTAIRSEDMRRGVFELLLATDESFVPPLSSRVSATDTDLRVRPEAQAESGSYYELTMARIRAGSKRREGLRRYFGSVLGQECLLAVDDASGDIIGLMSYRPGWRDCPIMPGHPCCYVSTVVIAPRYRWRGVARALFLELERFNHGFGTPVVVRTWSTNGGYTRFLRRLGFQLVSTRRDDRAPGIDTEYYRRDAKPGDAEDRSRPGSGEQAAAAGD